MTESFSPPPVATGSDREFARAFEHFRTLIDPEVINSQQPFGPAAVYTTAIVTWMLVYQRLHPHGTLEAAVAEFIRTDPGSLSQNRRVRNQTLSSNTGGYSRARSRLKAEVTDWVADQIYDSLVAATPPWLGNRRVFTVDGSTISLAPTKSLRQEFPPATNQHGESAWPVCQLVVAHELASGCAIRPEIGPMYGPAAVGELSLALRLLPRLPANSVLMGDRNFGVFAMAQAAVAAGHDIVFRLTESRFNALVRQAVQIRPGLWKLDWRPSAADLKKHPHLAKDGVVKVRLHEIRISEKVTLWIVTTLSSSSGELADLYLRRQDVETDIRNVKQTLKLDELRVKSPDLLRKELAASIVAYNLVMQIRRQAAKQANIEPRRISFTGVWSLVRIILLTPNNWTAEEWEAKFRLVLRAAAQRKLPNRPGRHYPREVIPRKRKFPQRRTNKKVEPPK